MAPELPQRTRLRERLMMRKKRHPKTCAKCPHAFRAEGCPLWIDAENGFMETNVQTGETRILEGCFPQVFPKIMAHVVRAANRPAAALESWRNEMVNGFAQIGQTMTQTLEYKKEN